MGDEFAADAGELTAGYALYGTTGWDDVTVYDSAGLLWRRDLHAETGLSPNLVRVSWGGARHRDRYRWASWSGRLRIDGTAVEHVTPWAITHPEQIVDVDGPTVAWDTKTYGADIGIVIRLADLSRARFELDATVQEDGLRTRASLSGAELVIEGHRDITVGGLNLRVRLERIADPKALPTTVTGELNLQLPKGDSAIYVRGKQFDGHQVWTSPLFVTRTMGTPS